MTQSQNRRIGWEHYYRTLRNPTFNGKNYGKNYGFLRILLKQSIPIDLLFPASGKRPVHGEPPTAEDVLRSIARVLERPSTEASDVELLQWIGEDSWIARHFCRMSRDFL